MKNFAYLIFTAILMLCGISQAQVSPIQGLGTIQLFNNNGGIATAGCFYFYQAGSTIQVPTYTDSTGTVQNANPLCVSTGARATVWLVTATLYKIVGCLANDGPTCAPADVLFSQDSVPGGPPFSGGGSGSSPFISSSVNPATTGILRLASGDSICWRNAANSANLCLAKDSSDVLSWASGILKFPEITCAFSSPGFDYWCADSPSHHWKFTVNGSSNFFSPGIATAGTSGHVVTLAANGIDLQDGGAAVTYPNFEMALGGFAGFSGIGGNLSTNVCAIAFVSGNTQACWHYTFANAHTAQRVIVGVAVAPIGCGINAIVGIKDLTTSTILLSATPTALGTTTTTGSIAIPSGDVIGVGLLTASTGCGTPAEFSDIEVIYQ